MQAARRVLLVLSHPASPPFRASHPLCHAWERERIWEPVPCCVRVRACRAGTGNIGPPGPARPPVAVEDLESAVVVVSLVAGWYRVYVEYLP